MPLIGLAWRTKLIAFKYCLVSYLIHPTTWCKRGCKWERALLIITPHWYMQVGEFSNLYATYKLFNDNRKSIKWKIWDHLESVKFWCVSCSLQYKRSCLCSSFHYFLCFSHLFDQYHSSSGQIMDQHQYYYLVVNKRMYLTEKKSSGHS